MDQFKSLSLSALAVVVAVYLAAVLLPNYTTENLCLQYNKATGREVKLDSSFWLSKTCYVKVKGEWWSLAQVRIGRE